MTQKTFSGGCLCGSVQYKISGEVLRFYHCHCSRCRKMTGTGHATNLVVNADTVEWLAGESLLAYFKLPDAARFFNQFCKQCGSPLPKHVPERKMVIIPAGSLSSGITDRPEARIFWGSRAEWSCDADELPTFPAYPEI